MDLATLANLGEFVGGLVVMVSLIYLAHQVRQNTLSLRTENYARILDRMSTIQAQIATDGDLNRIVVRGCQDPTALTPSERIRFTWAMYELIGAGEFMFHQGQGGTLPEDVWERWRATIVWWLSFPGVRLWWAARPSPFSRSFETFVEEVLHTHPVDQGAAARWTAFIAGEGVPSLRRPEPVSESTDS
ncbi:MAG: hypothetical protein AB7T31_07015 [Gemmatimonadales bacterium]